MAGGSQIIINDEGITLITPGKFKVKSGGQNFEGPQEVGVDTTGFPVADLGINREKFTLLSPSNKPLLFSPYTIASSKNSFEARPNIKGETRMVFTENEENLEVDFVWVDLEGDDE